MNLQDLANLVNGTLLSNSASVTREVKGAFAADLMSDVLASIQPEAVLVTGLCNPQVVRTSQMADVAAIILVRGKKPQPETLKLATEEGIPFIFTPFGMFEVCGLLHRAGLISLEHPVESDNCECE
jgi:predicted transcriptional regulator